jgi:aspartyl/asparaginyl-tRNA synthetase
LIILIIIPSSTDEKHLGNLVREKYSTDFYILKEYPTAARAFYSMPSSKDPKFSHSYDFMLRGQEVLSGAQRISDPALLRERMKAVGLDPAGAGMKEYVDAFSYGTRPHAGGAFGLERIVANWLNLPNVRLGTMFPRDPGRLEP